MPPRLSRYLGIGIDLALTIGAGGSGYDEEAADPSPAGETGFGLAIDGLTVGSVSVVRARVGHLPGDGLRLGGKSHRPSSRWR